MEKETGRQLCRLLAEGLHEKQFSVPQSKEEQKQIQELAKRHKVLSLLYRAWEDDPQVQTISRQTVQQSYHLLFFSRYVIQLLAHHNIPAVLLKGSAAAQYYPVPELRKSGDVDLLLENEAQVKAAWECLSEHGFTREHGQEACHHIACESPEHICVELHSSMVEPFDNAKTNERIKKQQEECFSHIETKPLMGLLLPVLENPYHAYHLLLHMLQDFLRAGFGLRLLCDWVVFWEQGCSREETLTFQRLVRESRIEGFAIAMTAVCVHYLGLAPEKVSFWDARIQELQLEQVDALLDEIIEAGEFGESDNSRMVTLRGTHLGDYIREFHHQTMLTYPKAGRYPILFPILWICTLCGFLYRNRSLRGVSGIQVLKNAGKRSKLVEKMKLFQ